MNEHLTNTFKQYEVSKEAIPWYEDLFASLPTQAGVKRLRWMEVAPTTSIESTGPIQFQINVGKNEQIFPCGVQVLLSIDIRNSRTREKLLAKGPDGVVNPANCCIPVGEMGHAVFQDIKVFLNNTRIDGGDALYPYRGAFYNRLFTPVDKKQNSLKKTGFDWNETIAFENLYSSPTEYRDAIHANSVREELHEKRKKDGDIHKPFSDRFIKSQTQPFLYYIDSIYSDIFQQPKPLPPGANLSVHFTRSKPQFCLNNKVPDGTNIDAYIHFEYCTLMVPVLELEPEMASEMNYIAYTDKTPMKFPLRSVSLQAIPKNAGMRDLSTDSIITGKVTPRRIFVALVNSDAVAGNYGLDPFNFGFYNVREMACKLGGEISSLPILKCPSEYNYLHPIMFLEKSLGSDFESGIDESNFKNRNAIFTFDVTGLSGNELANCYVREMKQPTGLHLQLASIPQHPHDPTRNLNLTILVYKEYDAEIHINADGKVVKHPYA